MLCMRASLSRLSLWILLSLSLDHLHLLVRVCKVLFLLREQVEETADDLVEVQYLIDERSNKRGGQEGPTGSGGGPRGGGGTGGLG